MTRIRKPDQSYMSIEEFKDHIKKILGVPEITGAKRADPCLVREADHKKPQMNADPTKPTDS